MHGVFLLDKPAGITSMRAVERVKRALGVKKAGHTGTLDPIATGVLAICFGHATRIAEYLLASSKSYAAEMAFGTTTTTLDAEGEVTEQRPIPEDLDRATLEGVLSSFEGTISQVPPAFSALKVKGKRAYELARAGKKVELAPRDVTISMLTLTDYQLPVASFVCEVSKGTYIRSLIRDIGDEIGCGAHMTALRRLNVGVFPIDEAMSLDDVEAHPDEARKRIVSMSDALSMFPLQELTDEEMARLNHGCVSHSLSRLSPLSDGPHRVLCDGELIALLHYVNDTWKIIRVFHY